MTNIVNGVVYVCEEGVCRMVDAAPAALDATQTAATRLAEGYMNADAFLAFLTGSGDAASLTWTPWLVPSLILGGFLLNLTPCVLPLVPVNLLIIGSSWKRGLLYGLGMAVAYGVLGVLASLGGVAFGTIQSSPFFTGTVALLLLFLALSQFGVFHLDFARYRFQAGVFLMGAGAAVLAAACVAPILISVLVLTADLVAKGVRSAVLLPFCLGLGLALPWPFLGAGMHVLPKPGRWMKTLNRIFALLILALAGWYAHAAFAGLSTAVSVGNVVDVKEFSLHGLKRPVLVDCWASWCKNCAAMEKVLTEPRVAAALKEFTLVRLRAEDLNELRQTPGFEKVQGLPAFVIFDDASRKKSHPFQGKE